MRGETHSGSLSERSTQHTRKFTDCLAKPDLFRPDSRHFHVLALPHSPAAQADGRKCRFRRHITQQFFGFSEFRYSAASAFARQA